MSPSEAPVAQQDVVVGALADEGLVAVKVLAGGRRPAGSWPARVSWPFARESSVGPGPRRFSAAPSAPVRARAPPSAASMICCLAHLPFFFYGPSFFWWAAHSRPYLRVWPGRIAFTRFCAEKCYSSSPYIEIRTGGYLVLHGFSHDDCLILA